MPSMRPRTRQGSLCPLHPFALGENLEHTSAKFLQVQLCVFQYDFALRTSSVRLDKTLEQGGYQSLTVYGCRICRPSGSTVTCFEKDSRKPVFKGNLRRPKNEIVLQVYLDRYSGNVQQEICRCLMRLGIPYTLENVVDKVVVVDVRLKIPEHPKIALKASDTNCYLGKDSYVRAAINYSMAL